MGLSFGSYRVVEEIGSGALSTVYKAIQEPLGRTVAVKALKRTIAPSSPFAKDLEREGHVLGTLSHPNVVSLFDFVKGERELYLVLEYVDGKSLTELLARKKKLRPEVVAAIGAEVARGLEHVHAHGYVHRDVKPANILFSKSGDVKLVDFGIAQRERTPQMDEPIGHADPAAFGTPAYMSPEQILGEFVDARSDLFSLGVVLYQMVAEVRPFDSDDPHDDRSAAQRIRRDAPRPLRARAPDVPKALERVILRLLEKLPADRFSSAEAVADELDEIARGNPRTLIVRALKEAGLTQIATPFGAFTDRIALPGAPSLKEAMIGFLVLFAVLCLGDLAIQMRSGEAKTPTLAMAVPSGSNRGAALRVVATPWAEVWVDGERVETTPFAHAIPLSVGTHFVKLVHPDAEPELRTISLAKGETGEINVSMRLRHTPFEPPALTSAAASATPPVPETDDEEPSPAASIAKEPP